MDFLYGTKYSRVSYQLIILQPDAIRAHNETVPLIWKFLSLFVKFSLGQNLFPLCYLQFRNSKVENLSRNYRGGRLGRVP